MNAFISGVTAGFGLAMTEKFIAKGHKVIGTGRRGERLQAIQEKYPTQFFPLCFDVSDQETVVEAINQLPEDWKNIDLLINNAGLALGLNPAHQAEMADWQAMINTNINGVINLTHSILPLMVARNHGHIINLSSTAGNYPYYGSNVYGATKAFIKQFSLNLRADLVGTKVRVSNVEPGLIAGTEFSNVRFHGNTQKAAEVYQGVENMDGNDIANIVLWIAEQPENININRIEIMPTAQTFAGLKVSKTLEN